MMYYRCVSTDWLMGTIDYKELMIKKSNLYSPLPSFYMWPNSSLFLSLRAPLLLLHCVMCDWMSPTVKESDSDTIIMVIVLVAGVGGVFILFALMALCYR